MAFRFRRATLFVALASLALSAAALVAPGASAGAASAVGWLATQQLADGGFEVAGFPGFETPDAVAGIAAEAQADGSWSTAEALDGVLSVETVAHETALRALDDYADGSIGVGQAAKLIVLVTNPLGLDPSLFDPECDGGTGVDLASILGNPGTDGTYGISTAAFNQILFAARAADALGGSIAPATVQVIRDAQRPDGSYAYNGNPVDDPDPFAFDDSDVDTTAAVVLALRAAGIAPGDATLDDALAWMLASAQRNAGTGAWQAFGSDDPNATAVAMLALHSVNPTTYATQLTAGANFLLGEQDVDGHIASPNDFFSVNTFATAQAVQALKLSTIPDGGTGGLAACVDGNLDGVPDDAQPAVDTVPSFDGDGYVTVASNGGTLTAVSIDPSGEVAPPTGVTLSHELVGFEITGLTPGATVTVTVTFHTGLTDTKYYKLRSDDTWLDFSDHAVISGNTVTLTLTDDGAGDDDPADGTINDPGAPAVVVVPTSPPVTGGIVPVVADPRGLTG
ncbi:MAG: hypothetical protein EXQ79_06610 [Acidimicrobiia bacterium]|nr:hypothetical protein [Acidimicrobiia bacterium]